MDYQEVQDLISHIRQQQQSFQESLDQLTKVVLALNEENNRLQMVNHQLEDELHKYIVNPIEQKVEPLVTYEKAPQLSGHERLRGFYEDGIHVCHELYGKRRQSSEDCLFCQDVLSRLEKG